MSPADTIKAPRLFAAEPARPGELAPAFRLIFQRLPEEEREGRVRRALALLAQGELCAEGVLVVRGEGALRGALVCVPLAGASGLVWPPQVVGADGDIVEDGLVRAALAWLRCRGAKLGQALLLPSEAHLAGPLERNGFRRVTRLVYLKHPLEGPGEDAPPALALTYETYTPANRDAFHDTLLRSYEYTLDCPEMDGVRTVEDIVAGLKGQGGFDPERWWLALADGRPVGVLVATAVEEWDGWDVAYVGVVPEARGQGVGRALTGRLLRAAREAGAAQVTLAVDERNTPARGLYTRLGFEPFDERDVYLAFYT